jgi:hypothetical protein
MDDQITLTRTWATWYHDGFMRETLRNPRTLEIVNKYKLENTIGFGCVAQSKSKAARTRGTI